MINLRNLGQVSRKNLSARWATSPKVAYAAVSKLDQDLRKWANFGRVCRRDAFAAEDVETTAMGAAISAGIGAGVWSGVGDLGGAADETGGAARGVRPRGGGVCRP